MVNRIALLILFTAFLPGGKCFSQNIEFGLRPGFFWKSSPGKAYPYPRYNISDSEHNFSPVCTITEGISVGPFHFSLFQYLRSHTPNLHANTGNLITYNNGSFSTYESHTYILDYEAKCLSLGGGLSAEFNILPNRDRLHIYIGGQFAYEKIVRQQVVEDQVYYKHETNYNIDSTHTSGSGITLDSRPIPVFSASGRVEFKISNSFGINLVFSYINFPEPISFQNYHYNRHGMGVNLGLSYYLKPVNQETK